MTVVDKADDSKATKVGVGVGVGIGVPFLVVLAIVGILLIRKRRKPRVVQASGIGEYSGDNAYPYGQVGQGQEHQQEMHGDSQGRELPGGLNHWELR